MAAERDAATGRRDDGATPSFHVLGTRDTAAALETNAERGLSHAEAVARLARHGPNVIAEKPQRSPAAMLLGQFTDFTILVLIGAAVVSALFGDVKDTVVILAIVALNGAVGFIQDFRAERALAALKKLTPSRATVVRDGQARELHARDIVPGDVVILEAGGVVPADIRLTDAHRVLISEAALTGESVPVAKHSDALPEAELPLGDRRNMAFKGTTVTYGRGAGMAVATGMGTELGRVAGLLSAPMDTQTPLQRRLTRFGKTLALAVIAVCAVVFAAGILRGEPPVLMFLTAVSLAVAAIPEALPATVTISLAFGARAMAERNAVVRRLAAVESLGSVTTICSDKTGTLTRNQMAVDAVVTADGAAPRPGVAGRGDPLDGLYLALALDNDARMSGDTVIGDPTEAALLRAAADHGLAVAAAQAAHPRLGEIAFDSERKRMTTIHRLADRIYSFSKGAPEAVIPRCAEVLAATGAEAIDAAAWLSTAEEMAGRGLRVLAIGRRRWAALPDAAEDEAVESGLTLLGLVGLIDPPRDEATAAVAACASAGIAVVMITGDHPATARAVARRLGIVDDGGAVMDGPMLAHLDEAALAERAAETRVYARIDPAQKIKVVEALQRRGEIVAMTGDGVNDAPALRRADIGVAMGRIGTDVARESADLVLLDDNFATIVAAVREGRRIYDNLRKIVRYVMTGNAAEFAAIVFAPFLGMPIPLLPIHILWINLVSDGLPALALTTERAEADLMRRPPRPPQESIFAGGVWQHILAAGGFLAALSLLVQAAALATRPEAAQTMVFVVLTFGQVLLALAVRSEGPMLANGGPFANLALTATAILVTGLQLAIIYVPALNEAFDTVPLGAAELALCGGAALAVPVAVEIAKVLRRRRVQEAA
jgi:Ca2+-transporting ATPase